MKATGKDVKLLKNQPAWFQLHIAVVNGQYYFSYKIQRWLLEHRDVDTVYYKEKDGNLIKLPISKEFRIKMNMNINR